MRKLSAGNKGSFITFTVIILIIIALLIVCLKIALNVEKEEYELDSNNFLYDEEYNPILLENSATITKKWNGSYYLKENNEKKEQYKLGNQCISYQTISRTLNLYGSMYRIYTDGSVEKITKHNEISKISEDQFYKLADRKYLLVGENIFNENRSLETKDYLLILIDKAGNTFLLNNELNSKAMKPMKIYTNTFYVDVANEKMYYNDKEIDLKKIIGSTNQYVEPEKDDNKNEINDNQNNINQNNGIFQNIINQNNTTIINNQNINNSNNSNTVVNNNSSVIDNSNNNEEKIPLTKSVSIKDITTTSTTIDISYLVVDPENKYQTVSILVTGPGVSKTIALDKDMTVYKVTHLSFDQEYKIVLFTKTMNTDGQLEETVEDVTYAKTKKIDSKLSVTKLTRNKICFKLNLDQNLNIDSAEIAVYVKPRNGIPSKLGSKEIDIAKSFTNDGWDDELNITYMSGQEIILKLENVMFNNKKQDITLETTTRTY